MIKKILLTLALSSIIFTTPQAQLAPEPEFGKFQINFRDTCLGSDSGAVRVDTLYSPWQELFGRFLSFAAKIIPGASDTDHVDDSLFIDIELSYEGFPLVLIPLDTLTDDDSEMVNVLILDETIFDADASILPPKGRLRVIHYDSFPVGTGIPDTLPSEIRDIYEKTIEAWWGGR